MSFAESSGTFTNSERRIQKFNKAVKPVSGLENWEVILKLANLLGAKWTYSNPSSIFEEVTRNIREYFKADKVLKDGTIWPVNDSPVLYSEGFKFDDGKAKLQVVGDGLLFRTPTSTDHITNEFKEYLSKELNKKYN